MKLYAIGCAAAFFACTAAGGVHETAFGGRLAIRGEPAGFDSGIVISQGVDRLYIDGTKAFAGGMQRIVCEAPAIDDAALAGGDMAAEVSVGSPDGGSVSMMVLMWKKDAAGEKRFHALRSKRPVSIRSARSPVRCMMVDRCPEQSGGYRLRFDLGRPGRGGRYEFFGGRLGPAGELRFAAKRDTRKAVETMYIPFDGKAEAASAKGDSKPIRCSGVEYAAGIKGQAVKLSAKNRPVLQYHFENNVDPRRGTVSMWICRDPAAADSGRWLFASPVPLDARLGTGALHFWIWGDKLRIDTGDDYDSHLCSLLPDDGNWHHVAAVWHELGSSVWVDGGRAEFEWGGGIGNAGVFERATRPYAFSSFGSEGAFSSFFIGSQNGHGAFNGLIDEVRIFSQALDDEAIKRMASEYAVPQKKTQVDYAALSAARGRTNPYLAAPLSRAGFPGETELVCELNFDRKGLEKLKASNRFDAVGEYRFGRLGDVEYLEVGSKADDRVAVGFKLQEGEPLYCFEIDYPDDAKRTMDVIVQDAFYPNYESKRMQNYQMQVGVMTGGDWPVSNRIRTHRTVYWAGSTDAVVQFMTAREGVPAAVAAVRLYRIVKKALPEAAIREPPRKNGWGRTIGWYYEDPSINYDFSVPDYAAAPEVALDMADRAAALMKYTGLNILAYPGTWYGGMIAPGYNPARHAPEFLRAFYERFDLAGLGVVPLINQHDKREDPGLFNYDMVSDGSVHATAVGVRSDGRPGAGFVKSPALFNICHPRIQDYYRRMVERFIADGVGHPSFKGVGVHFKPSSMCWLGSLEGGYNDYMIEAFERDTGIKVPVGRSDPMRGKSYAQWLLANKKEEWIQWRCDKVTGFWVEIARRLAAARPDLKLWIQNIANLDPSMDRFTASDYMRRVAREGGLDREKFAREAPNVIMGQTSLPADYRFSNPGWHYKTPADLEHQRTAHNLPEYWDFLRGAAYPLAHQHDRYWESAAGDRTRNRNPDRHFKADWFRETRWRVSTINAAGPYAMEHFAVPLRFGDVLGYTKGGYLIGTYGMENYLAAFAQAFRALPPVVMNTLPGGGEKLRLRHVDYDGRSYFYIVNTGMEPARVRLRFPAGTENLVTGWKSGEKPVTVSLSPFELKSYSAPSGRPQFVVERKKR